MTSLATKSRAKFLDEASALLATASPAVSAKLSSTRGIPDAQLPGESHLSDLPLACAACGSLHVLGWNSAFVQDPKVPRRTRQDRIRESKSTKTKIVRLRCSFCSATNTVQSEKRKQSKVEDRATIKSIVAPAVPTSAPETRDGTKPAAPSSSSKDSGPRKRARNNKSSLQSMLIKQKSAVNKQNANLDLADFMKG